MGTKRKTPMRQCIGCGQMKEKKSLLRVLKTPEGQILIDATGRKNGRGAYLCKSPACLEKAVKSKGLDRAFQMAVAPEVYEQLKKEMEELVSE